MVRLLTCGSCLSVASCADNHICVCVCIAGDMENQVEMEEKTRLINQVLELQHTLEGNTDTQLNLCANACVSL